MHYFRFVVVYRRTCVENHLEMTCADVALSPKHVREILLKSGVPATDTAFLLRNYDEDTGRWRCNLPALRRDHSAVMGFPDISKAKHGVCVGTKAVPVLMVAASESGRVHGSTAAQNAQKDLLPHAVVEVVQGADHFLHRSHAAEVARLIQKFMQLHSI